MTFFPVVLGVMAISILLVHWLTNYFGCRLEYKSLLLCAVMAFAVVIGAILMSPYLTQAYYIRLGALILAASAVVTAYNEYLVHRKASIAVAGEASELPEEEQKQALAELGKLPEQTEDEASDVLTEEAAAGKGAALKVLETEELPIGEELPMETELEPAEADSGKPAASEEAAPEIAATEQSASEETATEQSVPEKPAAEESISETLAPEERPAASEESVEKDADAAALAAIDAHLGSLDSILDYAYAQCAQGNIRQAILANQKALERYVEDEYAPFIAIDLGNLYKGQADYDAAIQVYEKALDIPAIARNDATYQEFTKNLSYLRTVQYILSKHNALDTPFQEIPQEYLDEIEADFQSATYVFPGITTKS